MGKSVKCRYVIKSNQGTFGYLRKDEYGGSLQAFVDSYNESLKPGGVNHHLTRPATIGADGRTIFEMPTIWRAELINQLTGELMEVYPNKEGK